MSTAPRVGSVSSAGAVAVAREAMLIEARSIERASEHLAPGLIDAIELLRNVRGRVLVSGLGKSGHIGAKIAATLTSTGTPAQFVHSAEALHGDSGAARGDDAAILISNSGETLEVCRFASMLSAWNVPIIAMTSNPASTLARSAQVHLDIGVEREADPLDLVPTASIAVTLAIGDALAAGLMIVSGFTPEDFAARHPGGSLGAELGGSGMDGGPA